MSGRRLLVALGGLVSSGCAFFGGSSTPVEPPPPFRAPAIEVEAAAPDAEADVAYLSPPGMGEDFDEILSSPLLRDPEFQQAVAWWIDYWRDAARPWFPAFVSRMGRYEETVDSALADRGMPASLRYLPLIESGYEDRKSVV